MSDAALEVWGSPISHSRSPELHGAAYAALGLDWSFSRREVTQASFADELRGSACRGLALTYPLKETAYAAAGWRDPRARATGVANTLLLTDDAPRAFNTDVAGLAAAIRETGADVSAVRIVGAGATATSALAAAEELGAERIEIAARRAERARAVVATARGRHARAASLADATAPVTLTISTLPGGTALPPDVAARLAAAGGTLYDVAYSPWPTPLAGGAWEATHHGLGMLLHQAVAQVRVFVTGDPDTPLPGEPGVVAAMRAALAG
ncbi:shikimate dehydrogenase [Microbacterium sp. ZXX196]|uniref:shikimate dehydrogenase n=1 Tax=Microbacterium sp. ZXX196 TaxID=2609291 RepID=UPI0013269F68|nr:shikimate dehydrogenase [Microbacterium sp. ZXX196]